MAICPILQAGRLANPSFGVSRKYDTQQCAREGCAWWHEGEKMCAILSLAVSLAAIDISPAS